MDKIKNFFSKNQVFRANNANNSSSFGINNFLQKNIFYLVFVIFIGIAIVYIVYLIKERKNMKGPKKIKPELSIYKIDDNLQHKPVLNQKMECPKNINQYSFAFLIQLDEFYCNTGYWKAIMVKGHEMNNKTISCGILYEKDVDPDKCFDSYDSPDPDLKSLIDSSLEKKVDVKDLSKRLQLVCQAIKVDNSTNNDDGTNLLCHSASKCNLFEQDKETLNMTKGQCANFVEEHKDYCNLVYKLDEKVARTANIDVENKKYDNYDNICSQENLLDKYPELLPKNLDTLKELKLINLAEKMDVRNGESRIDKSLEGCYEFDNIETILDEEQLETTNNDILQECNKIALGKSNYFGIKDNKCYTIDLSKEKDLIIKNKLDNQDCGNSREPKRNNIFISRALRPEENILVNCWENIIDSYPMQNPGVWLHPYKNDLRIVLTTVNNDPKSEYDKYVNEMIHPYKETNFRKLKNYNIIQIPTDVIEKHAFYSPEESIDKCNREMSNNNYYYKEYFDIKNIPIKEKFHFSIVINEKSVEVYINGSLNTTQFLFGNPNYNSGPLHINPGKNENGKDLKLNGMITDFKYFNKSINYQNIKNIMNKKSVIQNEEETDSN